MSRVRRRLRYVLIPLLLCLSGPLLATSDVQGRYAELERLRQRIASLQGELQQDRSRYDTLLGELRRVERQIGRIGRGINELKRKLDEQEQRLAGLQARRTTLQASIAEQRRYLGGQIRAAYAMGRQEYFKILLNQQDPSTVGRTLTYYDYLNKARSQRITALNGTIAELEQVRRTLQSETERLQALRRQREQDQREMSASRQERQGVVARLQAEISGKDRQLTGLMADESELKSLLKALTDALEDIPAEPGNHQPFARLKGKLPWPTRGQRLVAYGEPRRVGSLRWQGVVIAGSEGQEVRAVSHGRVAFADWLRGYGLLLIIDHGDGYMSLYGHNQSLYREAGEWVERGDLIAAVGNSGGIEKSALYFEIRKDGKPTDPVRWCRR
ncbi:MAG: peptidoglycan DD-metalloendopeptidase family protein [Gammaproteobacteria bacterium]|nr:peptidoglycan DD-metalloendopeptidase family protein [Gammaproteobacteria bacterium]